MKRAACRGEAPNVRQDPEARDPWFPGKGHSRNPGKMKCFTCPVRAECADYRDRTHATHGMWAGQIIVRDSKSEEDEEE